MTATHNGTCQACGREHALTKRGLAKHGYTVDWGYFNGVCSGSDKAPLELDTSYNEKMVEMLVERAATLEAKADGEIEAAPYTAHRRNRYTGKTEAQQWMMTLEAWVAFNNDAPYAANEWHRMVSYYRDALRYEAKNLREHADLLVDLRAKVHGQPLKARASETVSPPKREYFKSYREAYARVEALKAEGKVSITMRRDNVGFGRVVTYREA